MGHYKSIQHRQSPLPFLPLVPPSAVGHDGALLSEALHHSRQGRDPPDGDKKIADEEGISYPSEATLYKDTGFQGYEPAVKKTCQAKKKATPRKPHRG